MRLELRRLENNETLLSGSVPDQAALHELLERIRDFNPDLDIGNSQPSHQPGFE